MVRLNQIKSEKESVRNGSMQSDNGGPLANDCITFLQYIHPLLRILNLNVLPKPLSLRHPLPVMHCLDAVGPGKVKSTLKINGSKCSFTMQLISFYSSGFTKVNIYKPL